MATQTSDDGSRIQRILAYVFGAMILLTVIAFFAIVISQFTGPGSSGGFDSGIWPAVFLTPLIALPVALLILITLIVLIARRRVREAAAHASRVESNRSPRPNGSQRPNRSSRARRTARR